MSISNTTELLQAEQVAYNFIASIGEQRANRLLTMVCNRIDRRIKNANKKASLAIINNTCVRTEEWETNLMHNIKLGLTLHNTDSPEKARQRNLQRRAERKAQLLQRNAA